MRAIWEQGACEEMLGRFARLTPEQRPHWDKMNAIQMVRHCTVALDMMVGAAKVTPRHGPLRNPMLRYLIVHVLPWPKGAPTGAELITTGYAGNWENDLASLKRSLETLVKRGPQGPFEEHPAFGRLSNKSVGVLVWRHLDHHLRQFGIAK